MPSIYRILGQQNPTATTLTDIYTVIKPVRSAILSSISVANRSATPTSFRISVAVNGAVDSLEQYIAYDTPIAANDVMSFNLGITLAQGDVTRVYATLATLTFNVFGLENA
jgi:hypothetical protein